MSLPQAAGRVVDGAPHQHRRKWREHARRGHVTGKDRNRGQRCNDRGQRERIVGRDAVSISAVAVASTVRVHC